MGRLLFWMSKPDSGVPDSSWVGFLDLMAAMTALVTLVTVVITILCYSSAAGRRKVYVLDDLFASYTPMRWILLAIPAALLAGGLCFWRYEGALDSTEGRGGVALQIILLNGMVSAMIAYLLIILVHRFTPAKFRYRPAPYLHKRRVGSA
ncbi:MAG TPA: hypothetical protein VKU19_06220 [Bryobacteraceae bacterium]|nr:hypothetical protein [Bryobacteraceae bacterium]